MKKKIGIIGTGLIGGSIALKIKHLNLNEGIVLGHDFNTDHRHFALTHEIIDEYQELDSLIKNSEVIFISIPVDEIVSILPKILDKVENQMVIDIGSTKLPMISAVEKHSKRGRYLATHPMWGREISGPSAAKKESFTGKAVVLCNQHQTDRDVVDYAKHLYREFEMRIVHMDANEHDKHVAYVSHISHITSFALANTVLNKETEDGNIFNLASAGFESTVRLAKSSKEMWTPIFLQNKDYILDVLEEHIAQLEEFRRAIRKEDKEKLNSLITKSNRIKHILPSEKNDKERLIKFYELTRGLH